MIESVTFSPALSQPNLAALRQRLRSLLGKEPSRFVRAETFFELVQATATPEPPDAHTYIVFDLQRLILFRDSASTAKPRIDSLMRFLLDGYPIQPYDAFAAYERSHPYCFDFDLAVLEIIPRCLTELTPAEYVTIDLATAEIIRADLLHHPSTRSMGNTVQPPPVSSLRPVVVDRSLRSGAIPQLGDLVDSAAGVIRSEEMPTDSKALTIGVTTVTWDRGTRTDFCYGKTLLASDALATARCEAVERFLVTHAPSASELIRGSFDELAQHAIDPRHLFVREVTQGGSDAARGFDPSETIHWTWAFGPSGRHWRLIPAQEVWFELPSHLTERRFLVPTTSGCAVGSSFEEAAVFGALEAIERDAFLTSWYLRRPVTPIDLTSFESEATKLLLDRFRFVYPDYRVTLFDLTSDVGIPTVGGLAIRERGVGPRVFASTATHIDAEQACFRALKDLTSLRSDLSAEQWTNIRRRAAAPGEINRPSGHMDHYALDENFAAVEHWATATRPAVAVAALGRSSPVPSSATLRLDQLLEAIDQKLRSIGAALYIKDLSHPTLAHRRLHGARAITPGLYPLWFGARASRFAITDRLHRLASLYTGQPLCGDRLQLATHPLG